jgi:PAS domain S-box-containing protein
MPKLMTYATPRWPFLLAKSASIVTIIAGVLSLLGWMFYFWLPKEFLFYVQSIAPNLGVCLLFLGMALWIRCENLKNHWQSIVSVCTATVFLIAFITLFEFLFNIDLFINLSLFKKELAVASTAADLGRMSPFSAINLILISFSLFFIDSKTIRFGVHQTFMVIVLANSYFQLLSNIFNVTQTSYTVGFGVIIIFLILSIGTLFVRPYKGIPALIISKASGGLLARRIIPPALLLPILFGYVSLSSSIGFNAYATKATALVMVICILFTVLILLNSYFLNLTDRFKQLAEFNLQQHQAQLQAILNNTNSVISICDLQGKYILVNREFEKLFKLSSAEIVKKYIVDLYPAALCKQQLEENAVVIKTRQAFAVKETFPHDPEQRVYISNKFPIFNTDGIPYAIGTISTDVTEINKLQEIMHERGARLSLALQSAEVGTWSWDIPKDRIVWDEHLHTLFGIPAGSFSGLYETFINFLHPDDRQCAENAIRAALKERDEYQDEFRIIHPDSSIHHMASKGHVYRDDNGTVVKMAGICWNITKQKKFEEELRHAKEIAESSAAEANAASLAKTVFLASMSHEIRTPLNGVIGMTELLFKTPLNSDQLESVELIRISGETLLSVINDILDYSKIESEHLQLEQVDLGLRSLVEDTLDIFSSVANKKDVAFGAYIDTNVPAWIIGDPVRIRQILSNILNNAVKFTEKGEISVKISLYSPSDINKVVEDDYCYIKFQINDTGIGISKDAAKHLFQPFSQGDSSTARKFGGSGLGLVISKRLLELMDGSINIDSVSGMGTRVTFIIKVKKSSKLAEEVEGFKPSNELLKGVKILCVDDNAINREVIQQQTSNWGMCCEVARNAADALSKLKKADELKEPYQLVIIDNEMPDMTGFELSQIMHELKHITDIPTIFLFSRAKPIHPEAIKNIQNVFTLAKPFRQAKLYERIVAVLKHHAEKKGEKWFIEAKKPNNHQAHVLLVEDNAVNKQVASRILTNLGYSVEIVGNGEEALTAVQKTTYDLILMDCQMPIMDGYTAAKKIRKLEENKQIRIPIIAMTAYALQGDRELCLQAGMDDYVSKPIDMEELQAALNRWLPVSLIDRNRIQTIFGNDTNGIKEFLNTLCLSTFALLGQIDEAIKKQDEVQAKKLFHQLKGSVANSGICFIPQLCLQAEKKLKNNEWNNVKTTFEEIKLLASQLKTEIEKELIK